MSDTRVVAGAAIAAGTLTPLHTSKTKVPTAANKKAAHPGGAAHPTCFLLDLNPQSSDPLHSSQRPLNLKTPQLKIS
jgi:hypothetical protein